MRLPACGNAASQRVPAPPPWGKRTLDALAVQRRSLAPTAASLRDTGLSRCACESLAQRACEFRASSSETGVPACFSIPPTQVLLSYLLAAREQPSKPYTGANSVLSLLLQIS